VRQRLVSIAFGVAVLVACWLAAELVVAKLGILEVAPSLATGHPRRGYALRPNFAGVTKFGVPIHVSSLGLRSPEIAIPKPPGMRRVLVIGDSVTFGAGVDDDAPFPHQLELLLRDAVACPVEVVNAGVSGYNSTKELDYFANEGQLVEPDVVVVYEVENDREITHPIAGGLASTLKEWIGYRSYVVNATLYAYRLMHWRVEAEAAGGDRALYEAQQRAWGTLPGARESLDALHEIGRLARAKGTRVVLASHPNNVDPAVDAERNRLLREVADAEGMGFVDAAPAFRGYTTEQLTVSKTNLHPSALGHRLIANALLPVVRDALGCEARAH